MKTEIARQLRKDQTKPEQTVWFYLRNRRFMNLKFRRQLPIDRFVVDFACKSLRLIIELDGSQHADQKEYDAIRTAVLAEYGYKVVRFWNNQVTDDIDVFMNQLRLVVEERRKELGQ